MILVDPLPILLRRGTPLRRPLQLGISARLQSTLRIRCGRVQSLGQSLAPTCPARHIHAWKGVIRSHSSALAVCFEKFASTKGAAEGGSFLTGSRGTPLCTDIYTPSTESAAGNCGCVAPSHLAEVHARDFTYKSGDRAQHQLSGKSLCSRIREKFCGFPVTRVASLSGLSQSQTSKRHTHVQEPVCEAGILCTHNR